MPKLHIMPVFCTLKIDKIFQIPNFTKKNYALGINS